MTDHQIGNVYKGYFEYQDSSKRDFRRLLLTDITGDNNEIGIMTQITGQPPKDPPKKYDMYREPIHKWREAGLTKLSYARVNKNFPIPINVLNKPIGKLDEEEFLRIADEVLKYIHSKGFEH
jgi:mRNA interferase MazF